MKLIVAALVCLAVAAVMSAATPASAAPPRSLMVYVGTYTGGTSTSKGIYPFRLDLATGALTPAGAPAESASPSFLTLHPSGRYLYAVNETGGSGKDEGGVSAFAIDRRTGALSFLNQQSSRGGGPCHLAVDAKGRHVLVANYGGGSVAVLPVQPNGRLDAATAFVQHQGHGADPGRQKAPHAHWIDVDAANRYALAADLGLDQVLVYKYDAASGGLVPHQPPAARLAPAAGPRHAVFHPDGRRLYVINELNSTVTAFAYDPAAGALSDLQTLSTLPAGYTGQSFTAEIAIRPDGRFLYGSNRGHDSIAIFAVDPSTGKLTAAGHQPTLGRKPRNFAIDPTGAWLLAANQDSDSVVVFRIDGPGGGLTAVGPPVSVPRPVSVVFGGGYGRSASSRR